MLRLNWSDGLSDEEVAVLSYAVERYVDRLRDDGGKTKKFEAAAEALLSRLYSEYQRRQLHNKQFLKTENIPDEVA